MFCAWWFKENQLGSKTCLTASKGPVLQMLNPKNTSHESLPPPTWLHPPAVLPPSKTPHIRGSWSLLFRPLPTAPVSDRQLQMLLQSADFRLDGWSRSKPMNRSAGSSTSSTLTVNPCQCKTLIMKPSVKPNIICTYLVENVHPRPVGSTTFFCESLQLSLPQFGPSFEPS